MIQSISSLIDTSELLTLKLRGVDPKSGLLLVDADGLGSLEAEINSVGMPIHHGSRVNSAKIRQRNIVLTIAVRDQGLAEEINTHNAYKFFPTGEYITLGGKTLTRDATIKCIVESMEIVQFTNNEHFKVSLVANNPVWWTSTTQGLVKVSGTIPRFTFPFSNRSLTKKKIVFGEELLYINKTFNCEGEYKTGVLIKLHITGSVGDIHVYNTQYNQSMFINMAKLNNKLGFTVGAGDDILLDTRVGSKGMTVVRSATTYNAINVLEKDPTWIELFPGPNNIAYTATTGVDNVQMDVFYDILYKGL